jgi:branched-chain amino acid transport system permease protein
MSAEKLIESLIQGLFLGGIYATLGLGMSIIFGVMKIMNIAYGEMVILSSYIAYSLLSMFGVDPFVSLIFSAVLLFAFGFLLERFAVGKILEIESRVVLLTLSLSIILENAYLLAWSPLNRGLTTGYALLTFEAWGISIPVVYLLNFILSMTVMLALRAFLKRTYLGLAIRASSESMKMSQVMGINTEHVRAFALGLGALIAAISGVLIGLIYPFSPTTGKSYLIIAFGVTVIGGLGSLLGTF